MNGKKKIPIGIEFYKRIVDGDYYYVDKTMLIKDLLDEGISVHLFTRPRRFGKTLAVTMLKTFFEDERKTDGTKIDNKYYFEHRKIMDCEQSYLAEMGQYPVIFLTLKSVRQPNFEMAYQVLCDTICKEFGRHLYILKGDYLTEREKKKYQTIYNGKAQPADYATSLAFLSECLKKYHNQNTLILIDEYDVPLENAYFEGFYDKMIPFIRSLFESAFKTNDALAFAVITGCLRISKESIFTGFNNLNVCSILSKKYTQYFGFTQQETDAMLTDYRLDKKKQELKDWYDGYLFGETEIYNPWSVINYMSEKTIDSEAFPQPYWSNTSSNSIVRRLIERADESVKAEIEGLISGGVIEKPIHEDITYDEVYQTMDNLWNFMFFTGYFRKVKERVLEDDTRCVTLQIPNREIKYIFRQKIITWFQEQIQKRNLSVLHTAFIHKNTAIVEEELNNILQGTISAFDEQENYYHGLVAGLLTGIDGYITKSNRESGKGRSDLFIRPVSRRKEAFIVEFKVAKRLKELEAKAEEALCQIDEKKYDRELEDDNYSIISHYGIAFCRKECTVKLAEK